MTYKNTEHKKKMDISVLSMDNERWLTRQKDHRFVTAACLRRANRCGGKYEFMFLPYSKNGRIIFTRIKKTKQKKMP